MSAIAWIIHEWNLILSLAFRHFLRCYDDDVADDKCRNKCLLCKIILSDTVESEALVEKFSGFQPVTLNIPIECDENEDKGESDPTGGEEWETENSNLLIWQCYSRGDTTLPAS
jgi:hypothetical protein